MSEQEQIFVPNVFSPNGDNINDYFIPQSNLEISQISLMVFDRWGNQLFNDNIGIGTSHVNGWNGQSNGKDVPIGVYVYVVDMILSNGDDYALKGDFTILR
jgi:gliding motility-associated-like protein